MVLEFDCIKRHNKAAKYSHLLYITITNQEIKKLREHYIHDINAVIVLNLGRNFYINLKTVI